MHTTTRKFAGRASLALGLLVGAASLQAATVAYWNFDQGAAGITFATAPAQDLSGNGYTMFGFNDFYGPSYSADTQSGSGLSSRHDGDHQDGYTVSALNTWAPTSWTMEVTLKLDNVSGWRTIIGRDGSNSGPESNFYFQNNGLDDRFRINFATANGSRTVLDSDFVGQANQWYQFALVSDGSTVTMFTNKFDGNGYQIVGATTIVGGGDTSLAQNGANWTFGRGWFGGGFGDNISGNLDNIRFSDVALAPAQFLGATAIPEPSTCASLAGLAVLGLAASRRRRFVS